MGNVFTAKFLIIIAAVFMLSTALSYHFLNEDPQPNNVATAAHPAITSEINADGAIDEALEFSLNGSYDKSFPILKYLAEKNVTRAKLYLAVAYYHGQGTERDRNKAKALFLELQEKGYEPGIVNTYLSLILYSDVNSDVSNDVNSDVNSDAISDENR